jgi:hypothetical protein
MSLEASIKRLEHQVELLVAKTSGYDEAFRRGFEKGLAFALLMMQGRNAFDPEDGELKLARTAPLRSPKPGQLDLF